MNPKPKPQTGIARIGAACLYSFNGLRLAAVNEAAFRQEVALYLLLLLVLFFLPLNLHFKAMLLFANTLVLIVELLNSAVESIVDLSSPEYHALAQQAKDMGSAAVFLSLLLAFVLWGMSIYHILQDAGLQ